MNDQTPASGERTDVAPEMPQAAPAPFDPKTVEEGKAFAILSYAISFLGLPFFVIPLIQRNNKFSLYHAKQCLMLWIAAAAVAVASSVLAVICIGFIIGIVGGIGMLVLNVMGLMNAIRGEVKPLPLIGKWAEDWFKGIQTV